MINEDKRSAKPPGPRNWKRPTTQTSSRRTRTPRERRRIVRRPCDPFSPFPNGVLDLMATMINTKRLLTRVLSSAKKARGAGDEPQPVLEQFVYALCREDATPEQADQAFQFLCANASSTGTKTWRQLLPRAGRSVRWHVWSRGPGSAAGGVLAGGVPRRSSSSILKCSTSRVPEAGGPAVVALPGGRRFRRCSGSCNDRSAATPSCSTP